MTDKLYRETPCEHGHLRHHWPTPDGKAPEGFTWSIGLPEGMCPGGSRVEVTVDYEAARDVYRREFPCVCTPEYKDRGLVAPNCEHHTFEVADWIVGAALVNMDIHP